MTRLSLLAALALAFVATPLIAAEAKPIKVFILAGQSNMEGKAKLSLMNDQVEQPAYADLYAPFRREGKWVERADVRIKFWDREGPLTIGYGSPNCIGPELGFGFRVGDRYDEPVLLIKTAWGGRSLYRDFRPPSAGFPPEATLQRMLADLQKKMPEATLDDVKKPFGDSYRKMIEEVKAVTSDIQKHAPDAGDAGFELAGFIWFQGWNDMINGDATAEYTVNLKHFINDVRKDLGVPKLPFVIGQMGVDGVNASGNVKKFKEAQAAILEDAAFRDNVALVKTDAFWDTEAEAVFKKGWRENIAEWNKVGSDFPFHYLGSPRTLIRIGQAFADAVLELRGEAAARTNANDAANRNEHLTLPISFKEPSDSRLFEMRTYIAPPDKLAALHARFRDHTNKLFVKHGMELIGYWTPAEGPAAANTLIYILAYPSKEAREKSWKAFLNDPEWKKAKAESELNGKLVEKVDSVFLNPTDYSPIK